VEGDEGRDPLMEEMEDEAATETAVAVPLMLDLRVDEADAEAPPLGERPGDADGVGKPRSGVEPRLIDVLGNFE